jgi:Domain of unknown function (DUF1707)/2TM domain
MERPELRAADADRQRVVDTLQQHFVAGWLSSDELSERVTQARAARTYGDLDALLRDLPSAATPPAPRAETEEPRPAGRGKSFLAHAITYGLVMALLVAIWFLTDPGGYFWPIWPMLGWGVALAAHGLTRGIRG